MKLLLLTSWYPTKELPQLGIFFKKQAEILQELYDVKVVVCNTQSVGKKKALQNIFSNSNSIKKSVEPLQFEVIHLNIAEYTFLNRKFRIKKIIDNGVDKLKEIFNTWKPDIIHAHDAWFAGIIANKVSSITKIPFVLTCHSPFPFTTKYLHKSYLIKQAISNANQLLTVSNHDRRIYESSLEATINPITIGNYIDTETFNPIHQRNTDSNTFKIIQITRPFKIKDVPTFLKAISYFIKEYKPEKEVKATLVLSQTNLNDVISEIKKQAEVLEINKILEIKVNISNDDVAKELSTSDVYVSTSFYETFGVTIAEAISMGIPTILVDNGASSDFAVNNKNCIYAEMKDYKKIAEYLYKIFTNQISFDSEMMHRSIKEKYSKEIHLAMLNNIYKKVLSNNINHTGT